MGLFDKIKEFFRGKETAEPEPYLSYYEKKELCGKIDNLIRTLQIKDSFNYTVLQYSSYSYYQLLNMDPKELNRMYANLMNAKAKIDYRAETHSLNYDKEQALEKAAWTGEKLPGMTAHDLDRYQCRDDR